MTNNELRIAIKNEAMGLVLKLRTQLDEIMVKIDEHQPKLIDKYQDLETLIEAVQDQAIEGNAVFGTLWEDTND